VTTRHEFLAQLHNVLMPRGYLEVGVYSGDSLRLVHPGTPAIGIDPAPHLIGHFPGTTQVARTTSDNYFQAGAPPLEHIDLAFIDGMHLYEYALRDFMNIERYSNPRTVVVFDDVLPRNQAEAAREQCPGDWTGDVWKVPRVLKLFRKDLNVVVVNTFPTGTAVVWGLDAEYDWTSFRARYDPLGLETDIPVPDDVINRDEAVEPAWVLAKLTTYLQEN
jgi:hypothetical protein